MKLCKGYTNKPYIILVNDTILSLDNPLRSRKIYKMSISEKIKTIDNKIEQNKAQYDLDRQTAKISTLSLGNVNKYEFLTTKDILPEEDLLEKAAALKRFEYSAVSKELKAQIDIAKKLYQKLDNTDETINKKSTLNSYSKSDLIYDTSHSFFKYYNDNKKFDNLSFKSKYSFLAEFLAEFFLKPQNKITKKKKAKVYRTVSELCNKFLDKCFGERYDLEKETKEKYGKLYSETSDENYDDYDDCEEEEYIDLSEMPPLESDEEELKKGKRLKFLTPNKLLARFPILLAQIKAGKNSYKLKNKIKQILYLLDQHNKFTKNFYNNLIKSLQSWNKI